MSGRFDYADLFNEADDNIDQATIDDLTVTSSLDVTGAIITGLTIGTSQIADGAVTTAKLAAQSYIPFIDTSSPFNNTVNISIPHTGTQLTEFILADSQVNQTVNSALTFASTLKLSNYTPKSILMLDSSSSISATALTNGQLMIGSTGASPVAAGITSSSGRIIVTNGPGSIDLDLNSNDTLSSLTLTGASNQLIIQPNGGINKKFTITATNPAANLIYTIPDVSSNASYVMTAGTQTIGGVKSFTSPTKMIGNYYQVGDSGLSSNQSEALLIYPTPAIAATIEAGSMTIYL